MSCKDGTSNMIIKLDSQDHFVSFAFNKMTCGSPIDGQTGFQRYCEGKNVFEILDLNFSDLLSSLNLEDEQQRFILFLEWDALRSSLAAFFGIEKDDIDAARCMITSVQHDQDGITISEIILPPRDLPSPVSFQMNLE